MGCGASSAIVPAASVKVQPVANRQGARESEWGHTIRWDSVDVFNETETRQSTIMWRVLSDASKVKFFSSGEELVIFDGFIFKLHHANSHVSSITLSFEDLKPDQLNFFASNFPPSWKGVAETVQKADRVMKFVARVKTDVIERFFSDKTYNWTSNPFDKPDPGEFILLWTTEDDQGKLILNHVHNYQPTRLEIITTDGNFVEYQ